MDSRDASVCTDGSIDPNGTKSKVPLKRRKSLRSKIHRASKQFLPSDCKLCRGLPQRCLACRKKKIEKLYSDTAPASERIELHPIGD